MEGYIGSVEAQGCGTLHLHILLWLKGAPMPTEMKKLLHTDKFRQKIEEYINTMISLSIQYERKPP